MRNPIRSSPDKQPLSPELGTTREALQLSVNLSREAAAELKRVAFEQQVSESSIIEIALRQLFRRFSPERLGTFLKENGACLRRRS